MGICVFHFRRLVCSKGNSVASDMNCCRLLVEAEPHSFVIWALHVVVNDQSHGMSASCPELHSTVTTGFKTEWRADEKNLLLLGIESESLRTWRNKKVGDLPYVENFVVARLVKKYFDYTRKFVIVPTGAVGEQRSSWAFLWMKTEKLTQDCTRFPKPWVATWEF